MREIKYPGCLEFTYIFIKDKVPNSGFLYSCPMMATGKSSAGEVMAPLKSVDDVPPSVLLMEGKKKQSYVKKSCNE